jgi:metal-responsive CopG/Arc/MetJ family transcriptional regulator
MPKKKVAIAISEWLLGELDSAAQDAESSRSALVEEAVADYVVRRRTAAAQKAFLADASFALEDMQRFADDIDSDPVASMEPPSLEKLRALRAVGRGVGA